MLSPVAQAVDCLEVLGLEREDTSLDAYLSLARFADVQYQNIVNYMKSTTYESKQALIRQAKQTAEELRAIGDNRYIIL